VIEKKIIIVDYGMGNSSSIKNMLKKVGFDAIISSDKNIIADAAKLILPGVGAFDRAMGYLKELELIDLLNQKALIDRIPVLGICLGMQIMAVSSNEGSCKGLSWFDAKSVKFDLPSDLKVPHMGWNEVEVERKSIGSELFHGYDKQPRFYFVHSYYVLPEHEEDILAYAFYGNKFVCAIHKNNLWGVQFHPEKSHKFGMLLLKNFAEMTC
jgi:imidazole glycerol-phosphate synthase subunit HisH